MNEVFVSIWIILTKIILNKTSKLQKFIEKFKTYKTIADFFFESYIYMVKVEKDDEQSIQESHDHQQGEKERWD